ncbi:sphingomyelin phosphodiesterase [Streptomyces sp. ODS05-4]|uniref:sphingomyelin phosphodiesterase n=1 Tax=Streptomyces sp. ODS05-4 TaxID=2944939 RepID=UPI00210F0706|nr:sphingomyelin phosphodiesterase [Streptomyces sp. ODS05-4]
MRLRTVALLTATAVLAGVPSLASAAPGGRDTANAQPALRIMTTNTMLLPSFVTDGWAQDVRGGLIGSAPYLQGHDVVVFQELFDNSASDILMKRLQGYPHRTPVVGRSTKGWDETKGDYSALAPEDGGVAIASRWPITRRTQYVFDEACGTDGLSQKGFAYARLDVNGSAVHVLGTHLQADDSLCGSGQAARVRTSQLREMRSFVDGLGIPADEPVVFAGDLNVDRGSGEYPGMIATLDAAVPAYDGHPYTSDPVTNALTRKRYPDSPRQWLDYVLYDNRHARPSSWRNTGQEVSSPVWKLSGTTYTRYSDHYPVLGS